MHVVTVDADVPEAVDAGVDTSDDGDSGVSRGDGFVAVLHCLQSALALAPNPR